MRIAQIAPLYEAVPPERYGGTERVIAALCDGLIARGHEVTLSPAGSSETGARLMEGTSRPLRARMTRQQLLDIAPHLHLHQLADAYARANEFDVIHSHADLWTLPFAWHAAVPTVITMHGRLD